MKSASSVIDRFKPIDKVSDIIGFIWFIAIPEASPSSQRRQSINQPHPPPATCPSRHRRLQSISRRKNGRPSTYKYQRCCRAKPSVFVSCTVLYFLLFLSIFFDCFLSSPPHPLRLIVINCQPHHQSLPFPQAQPQPPPGP